MARNLNGARRSGPAFFDAIHRRPLFWSSVPSCRDSRTDPSDCSFFDSRLFAFFRVFYFDQWLIGRNSNRREESGGMTKGPLKAMMSESRVDCEGGALSAEFLL